MIEQKWGKGKKRRGTQATKPINNLAGVYKCKKERILLSWNNGGIYVCIFYDHG